MGDLASPPAPEESGSSARASLPHEVLRAIRRDPQHLPERLVQIAHQHLSGPAHSWAEEMRKLSPGASGSELAETVRINAAHFARVNGGLSGTPFLIVLVPAYVNVLWEDARMVMRIAAVSGQDPRGPTFPSELLALRGLYETPEDAERALEALGPADTAAGKHEPSGLRIWVRLVYRILILGGFVSAPAGGTEKAKPSRILKALSMLFGFFVFWVTWVIPVTFMIAMSWSCESDTRQTGSRAMLYYGDRTVRRKRGVRPGRLHVHDPGSRLRTLVHVFLLILSLGIPLALVSLAISDPVGHSELYVPSAFVALLLVVALSVRAARR